MTTRKGVYRKIQRSDGRVQKYRIKHLKQFNKKYTKIGTEKGRKIYADKNKPLRIKEDGLVEAYEIESQTSYAGKTGTQFDYTMKGIFENEPKPEKIEIMAKNSLVKAWHNSAKTTKNHKAVPTKLYDSLGRDSIRGYAVRRVRVSKDRISNSMHARIQIKSNGKIWEGEN